MRSRVVFAEPKLKEAFEKLKDSKGEDQKLYKWLYHAFDNIAEDAFCGIQIPKKLIDNLWKYNLPNAWRLLYSVARDEIIVISIVLEWLPHKEYERRFKY